MAGRREGRQDLPLWKGGLAKEVLAKEPNQYQPLEGRGRARKQLEHRTEGVGREEKVWKVEVRMERKDWRGSIGTNAQNNNLKSYSCERRPGPSLGKKVAPNLKLGNLSCGLTVMIIHDFLRHPVTESKVDLPLIRVSK